MEFTCCNINEGKLAKVIFSDEDKCNSDGSSFFEPHFKPGYNKELLFTNNYICHFLVCEAGLMKELLLRKEFDGAQDFDFVLRATSYVNKEQKEGKNVTICHVPKVLYHWRCHENSTAENPESKRYAFEAGIRALESHLERSGIKETVTMTEQYGLYRVKYELEKTPLTSILIPNKDHVNDLRRCIQSLYEKSNYSNFEIIIIENGSVEEATFAYYNEISKQFENVQIVTWNNEKGFNFSALNNYGASFAKGEYLLFLNLVLFL